MNTPSPEFPRFVCRVVRWWAALTDSSASTPSGATTTGHRAHCPACRAYFQTTAALDAQLRQAARTQTSAAPAGLEHRIADAVRRAQVPGSIHTRTSQRRTLSLWGAGLVTATAAVALVAFLNREPARTTATAEVAPAEVAAVFTAVTTLPQHFSKVFVSANAQPTEPDPLSRELDNVKADARSALSFLAENFLPAERPDPTSLLHDRLPAIQGS